MKKLATAITAIALIGTPAFAADMAVKAPPPPPAPVYSWTGWYVGGNVGGSWGNGKTELAGNGTVANGPFPASLAFADSNTAKLNGVIGGGQLGYNYQYSPNGVLGFEADIQGSGERGSGQFADPFATALCRVLGGPCGLPLVPLNGTALSGYQAKIDWFGTVRGRLGLLVGNELLIYATGGLAYGRVAVSGNSNVSAVANDFGTLFPFTPATGSFDASKTNFGFAVGAGLEGRFSYWLPANWTWKLEYLYVDLGSLDTATSFSLAPPVGAPLVTALTGTLTTHTHFTDNIVRVGLNYQFH